MVAALLERLGVDPTLYQQGQQAVHSPIDGSRIASVTWAGRAEVEQQVTRAEHAFELWRKVPAPRRGELVRQLGDILREYKADLGELVSWEAGKITQEGLGEVQEMIDICDFAVGLSRQLYGLTIASERPGHHMRETWHPLGVVGVISAFNFPVAVWSWNTALALVCGNPVIWKPSDRPGLPGPVRARTEELQRCPAVPQPGGDWRPRSRCGAGRRPARGADQRNRQYPHGP
jgi:aldehyde dehydrogenase (NAD+)